MNNTTISKTDTNTKRIDHHAARLDGLSTQVYYNGDPEQPTILLIHGATVAAWEYDALVQVLVSRGFHCLRYDLLGHGHSSKPFEKLSRRLLVEQAKDVLETCLPEKSFILVGHSLGGSIASSLTSECKDQVERLVLLAPLLNYVRQSQFATILRTPLLGKYFMQGVGRRYLRYRRHNRLALMGFKHLQASFDEAYFSEGFWQSMHALFKSDILACQQHAYEELGQLDVSTQVLWGKQDKIISESDINTIDRLLSRNPLKQPTMCLYGAEHNFVLTQPQRICDLILD